MATKSVAVLLLASVLAYQTQAVSETFVIDEHVGDKYGPNSPVPAFMLPYEQQRLSKLVNAQYPGPPIYAMEGDTISVNVFNNMKSELLSLHFHGQEQRGTPWMDGAGFVSECPISPGSNFTYSFTAYPAGTSFYHGHLNTHIAAGIAGPMIILPAVDPHAALYDHDENIVTVSEWFLQPEMLPVGLDLNWNGAGLINGMFGDGSAAYPFPVVDIHEGECSRLRFIGTHTDMVSFTVTIAGHTMTILALDGRDIEPLEVDSFVITIASRVDVVVCGDQGAGNYPITFTVGDSANLLSQLATGSITAMLRYGTEEVASDASGSGSGVGSTPPSGGAVWSAFKGHGLITPLTPTTPPPATVTFNQYVGLLSPANPNGGGHMYLSTTRASLPFTLPNTPMLHSLAEESCMTPGALASLMEVELGSVVEMVFNNLAFVPHPMHIHGTDFWVLGVGTDPELTATGGHPEVPEWCEKTYSDDTWTFIPSSSENWWGCPYDSERDSHTLNLVDPPMTDTVVIPARSWAVVRFVADNPGVWPIHCHTGHHQVLGMVGTIVVGRDQIPALPEHLPVCGTCSSAFVGGCGEPEPPVDESSDSSEEEGPACPNGFMGEMCDRACMGCPRSRRLGSKSGYQPNRRHVNFYAGHDNMPPCCE